MRIAIAGPVSTESVTQVIRQSPGRMPAGYAGAPFLGTLIRELLVQGHEVSAFTLDSSLDPDLSEIPCAVGDAFSMHYIPCRRHGYRYQGGHVGRIVDLYALERRRLADAMRRADPEVIHAHWSYEFALAALSTDCPTVVTCHDVPWKVLTFKPDAYRLGKYFMARRVFAQARSLTTVSPYMAAALKASARCPISVVPNPLPAELVANRTPPLPRPATSPPRLVMICNGWSRRKNPEAALRAFAFVRRRHPAARFSVLGADFGLGERAQRWSVRNGLDGGVAFLGRVPHAQVLAALGEAHVLLHGAVEESFGMTLVEAMACGVPVVAGSVSGAVPWVLEDGAAGVLTDIRDPEAIAQAVVSLLGDEERRHALAQRGRARAQRLCDPALVARNYLDAYRAALPGVPRVEENVLV
jgi:glycosyltransferase involved in cell wall biosynthesis